MALETATYIDALVSANPTSGDSTAQGDDHIRLIKSVLKSTFPNIGGPVTLSHTDINAVNSAPAETIKGNVSTEAGTTQNVTKEQLKNFLGLTASATASDGTYAAGDHHHDDVYAPKTHTHTAAQTTSGTFHPDRIPAATTAARGSVRKATAADMSNGATDRFPDAAAVKNLLNLGDMQMQDNGWVTLPGGLIIQWGTVETPYENTRTYTFPKQFPTKCFAMFAQPIGDRASFDFEVEFYSIGCRILDRTSYKIINEGTSTPVTHSHVFMVGH
jgi:hypothetical protein